MTQPRWQHEIASNGAVAKYNRRRNAGGGIGRIPYEVIEKILGSIDDDNRMVQVDSGFRARLQDTAYWFRGPDRGSYIVTPAGIDPILSCLLYTSPSPRD